MVWTRSRAGNPSQIFATENERSVYSNRTVNILQTWQLYEQCIANYSSRLV